MVNKLFKVLVVAALPAGAASCGGNTESSDNDAAANGSQTGAGGHSDDEGGQSSGGGSNSGGSQSSGGAPASGGASSGGAIGFAGSPQAPEDLDCPAEQWLCQDLVCDYNLNAWSSANNCVCDRSRARSEAACDEEMRFVCDRLDPSLAERGLISCSCVEPDLSAWDTCTPNNPSHTTLLYGDHCGCAVHLIR